MRETSLIKKKKKKTWQIIAENLLSAYGISQLGVTAARHLRLWTQKRKGSFVSSSGFNSPIAFGFWQGQRMAVAGTCVPVKSSHHQLGRETKGGDGVPHGPHVCSGGYRASHRPFYLMGHSTPGTTFVGRGNTVCVQTIPVMGIG